MTGAQDHAAGHRERLAHAVGRKAVAHVETLDVVEGGFEAVGAPRVGMADDGDAASDEVATDRAGGAAQALSDAVQ